MRELINEVKVISVADVIYHPGACLKNHSHHDYHQIFYITKNKAEFVVNGSLSIINENMFVLARPDVAHGIMPVSNDVYMLDIKFIVLDNDLADELNEVPPVFYSNDQLKAILYTAVNEGLKKDLYFERNTVHIFCSFLYKMLQQYKNFNRGLQDSIIRINPAAKIKEFIKEHYQEEISLKKLAENVGYTKNYLCRLFRDNTGITINEYLNSVRIHRAVDLLLNSDKDITEICRASGYTNIFHFMKTFKKLTRMSPESYRRRSVIGESFYFGDIDYKYSVIWTSSLESNMGST